MLFSVNQLQAQTIPNGGFETWVNAPTYEIPVVAPAPYFGCSNDESFSRPGFTPVLTVTEVPGVSGSAVRMENLPGPGGEAFKGFVSWGDTDQGSFSQGVPLPGGQGLTGLSLYLKYSIDPANPGFVGIIPTKNGVPVGPGNGVFPNAYIFPISGDQLTFTLTTFTLSPALAMNPDSCVIFITSADVINDGATVGDFVEADELTWIGNTNPLYGGSLDVWQEKPALLLPDVWQVNYGGRIQTFAQSSDAKFGSYSLELHNIPNDEEVEAGRAQLGHYECVDQGPCSPKPGMKLLSTPSSLVFYTKYSTPGVDNGQCYVDFYKNGVSVGATSLQINASSHWQYQYIQTPVLSQTPDSVFISFESGHWPTPVAGSVMKIDGIKFNYCNDAPTIQGPLTVCSGSDNVRFIISEEFASGYSWSTSVGSIAGTTTNDTVYVDDITADATISVVKSYADGCPAQTFNLNVTTVSASSANAGGDDSYCKNNSVIALSGSVTGATGGTWSGGLGTFDNINSLSAHYTPTIAELTTGTVTLTLTPTGTGGCAVTNDVVTYTFDASPTAQAGPATITKCSNNALTSLTGMQTGATGVEWTTLGSGTFSSDNTLATDYTPSVNEIQAGIATVVVTTTGNLNDCNAATDTVRIYFSAAPTVSAGSDQTICSDVTATMAATFTLTSGVEWISSGTGTFDDNTLVNAVYSPTVADKAAGSVILTVQSAPYGSCNEVTDVMTLTINTCTGVTMAGMQEAVTCYPNPATSQVMIDLGQDVQVDQVEIMNASQHKVKQVQVNALVDQYSLSLEGLEAGMYTIIVRTEEGVIVKKVIKQ